MKYSFNVTEFYRAVSKIGGTVETLAKRCQVDKATLIKASKGEKISLRSYTRISKVLGIEFEVTKDNI